MFTCICKGTAAYCVCPKIALTIAVGGIVTKANGHNFHVEMDKYPERYITSTMIHGYSDEVEDIANTLHQRHGVEYTIKNDKVSVTYNCRVYEVLRCVDNRILSIRQSLYNALILMSHHEFMHLLKEVEYD